MALPFQARAYETWAPIAGRILLAGGFVMGAVSKIPGTESFTMQVGMTVAAGVPFATVAVTLAFILELVAGVAIIIGWQTRLFAFILMLFTILLTALFHMNFADPMAFGIFMGHLYLIGGLLYVSVYGAQRMAVKTCPLPHGMMKS